MIFVQDTLLKRDICVVKTKQLTLCSRTASSLIALMLGADEDLKIDHYQKHPQPWAEEMRWVKPDMSYGLTDLSDKAQVKVGLIALSEPRVLIVVVALPLLLLKDFSYYAWSIKPVWYARLLWRTWTRYLKGSKNRLPTSCQISQFSQFLKKYDDMKL